MDTSREELRRRLREKIKGSRSNANQPSNQDMADKLKRDPTAALLSMGIDDPNILKNAKSIVDNPHEILRHMKFDQKEETKNTKTNTDNESSDEELPPECKKNRF